MYAVAKVAPLLKKRKKKPKKLTQCKNNLNVTMSSHVRDFGTVVNKLLTTNELAGIDHIIRIPLRTTNGY